MSDLLTRVTDVIRNKISNQEMFTLLDVSNAVKNDGGDFYSHSQIHDVAIPILDSLYPSFNYDVSVIDVQLKHGAPARANCYHPMGSDPNNYTNRNQEALKPSACSTPTKTTLQKVVPVVVKPTVSSAVTNAHATRVARPRKSDGCIQVSINLLVACGFAEGNMVDVVIHPNSISVIPGTDKMITRNFRIGSTALNQAGLGGSPVNLCAFNDKLVICQ